MDGVRLAHHVGRQWCLEYTVGLVINPRGTSGAGKTWLVRQVMAAYTEGGNQASPIMREGRLRPIGWQLLHPLGGPTLAVIGDYQLTKGGTDTISSSDGGLNEAFRLADALAAEDHDVLMEGFELSGEHYHTAMLAKAQRSRGSALHVLCLTVAVEECIQNVVARRRASQVARPAIERTARAGHEALVRACASLREQRVEVERLDVAVARRRALSLLGFDTTADNVDAGELGVTSAEHRGGEPVQLDRRYSEILSGLRSAKAL